MRTPKIFQQAAEDAEERARNVVGDTLIGADDILARHVDELRSSLNELAVYAAILIVGAVAISALALVVAGTAAGAPRVD